MYMYMYMYMYTVIILLTIRLTCFVDKVQTGSGYHNRIHNHNVCVHVIECVHFAMIKTSRHCNTVY